MSTTEVFNEKIFEISGAEQFANLSGRIREFPQRALLSNHPQSSRCWAANTEHRKIIVVPEADG